MNGYAKKLASGQAALTTADERPKGIQFFPSLFPGVVSQLGLELESLALFQVSPVWHHLQIQAFYLGRAYSTGLWSQILRYKHVMLCSFLGTLQAISSCYLPFIAVARDMLETVTCASMTLGRTPFQTRTTAQASLDFFFFFLFLTPSSFGRSPCLPPDFSHKPIGTRRSSFSSSMCLRKSSLFFFFWRHYLLPT